MTVKFHPAARRELQEAWLWYDERSPLSAAAFAQEVAAGDEHIGAGGQRGRQNPAIRRVPNF